MKKQMWNLIGVGLMVSTGAAASGQIRFGVPSYGGTGCPAGSASVTLSPDGAHLSLGLDEFSLEAGKLSGKTLDRKSCNLAIPVSVPSGYQVAMGEVSITGSNILPRGARSQINLETFFAGSRGPLVQRNFTGPIVGEFRTGSSVEAEPLQWSACGAHVILRINLNAMVMTNRRRQKAVMTVNPSELAQPVNLRWRSCDQEIKND